jgi:predicted CXXCH cytochrome family protein
LPSVSFQKTEEESEMKNLFLSIVLSVLTVAFFCSASFAEGEALSDSDCIKCHINEVKDVDANGASHKDVACTDCHMEHPPAGKNPIPECSMCHDPSDNAHFAVKGCVQCHYPHHPLQIDFTKADESRPACMACHGDKGEEMKAYPSAHSEQDCNSCHNNHGLEKGQYQTCLDCHEGHSESMKIDDCFKCHKPHSPTNVTYEGDLPAQLCASCHTGEGDALAHSTTKHHELVCAECHPDKHKNIMQCVECHDQPHGEYIHKKFPECLTCHRDPHFLAK